MYNHILSNTDHRSRRTTSYQACSGTSSRRKLILLHQYSQSKAPDLLICNPRRVSNLLVEVFITAMHQTRSSKASTPSSTSATVAEPRSALNQAVRYKGALPFIPCPLWRPLLCCNFTMCFTAAPWRRPRQAVLYEAVRHGGTLSPPYSANARRQHEL
jgi:hypothetical protein